jgi:hypothetical protein
MPIVNALSTLIHDFTDPDSIAPDPEEFAGRLVLGTGAVANEDTDLNTSMYHLADVPSNGIVHEDTFFDVASWGFAQVVIGTETDTDALVDQTKATEDIVTPFAVGDANHGKRWWEVLGLATDPGGKIGLFAHAEADAASAGSMAFRVASVIG